MSVNHLSSKQIQKAKKWGEHRKDVQLPDPEDILAKERCEMIAFKHQLSNDFPIEFGKEDWKIIDFEDRHKYKSQYYFQINVDKPSNVNEDGTTKDKTYEYIKNTGRPYLVCELSAFRQNSYLGDPDNWYYTLGWFHFLRQGFFNNNNSGKDRWRRIQEQQSIELKPWRTEVRNNDYALICLQKATDSTLIPMHETHGKYRHWLMLVINQIRNLHPDLPIVIRPHLRTKDGSYRDIIGYIEGVTLSKTWEDRRFHEGGKGLQEDLSGARFVVSYNSNVLTQAVLEGIPSICWDMRSAASPACLDPSQLSNLEHVYNIDRTQWLHNLSYTQWTRREIRDGQAWNHLKQIGF